MKSGPIVAMIALLIVGMALVLQPTLARGGFDFAVDVGSTELLVKRQDGGYVVTAPAALAGDRVLSPGEFGELVDEQLADWDSRPAFERTLLGFFNISGWGNFVWVVVGLGGQIAFFGRMFIQWVVSEKSRQSQVPELFWWLSFIGGVCLFTYFVWRVDVVGVIGQSTGVVIYARNLRLIKKQKRREKRKAAEAETQGTEATDAGAA